MKREHFRCCLEALPWATAAQGRAGPHAAFGGLILTSILGWTQSAAEEMLTLPVPVINNPFPAAPRCLSRWAGYARQPYLMVDVCLCVSEQIGDTSFYVHWRELWGRNRWLWSHCEKRAAVYVTWPQWGTAPSSPPASGTHPAASCREPGETEGPPQWSCRWPGRKWSRSGGTISAQRSTENNEKKKKSVK